MLPDFDGDTEIDVYILDEISISLVAQTDELIHSLPDDMVIGIDDFNAELMRIADDREDELKSALEEVAKKKENMTETIENFNLKFKTETNPVFGTSSTILSKANSPPKNQDGSVTDNNSKTTASTSEEAEQVQEQPASTMVVQSPKQYNLRFAAEAIQQLSSPNSNQPKTTDSATSGGAGQGKPEDNSPGDNITTSSYTSEISQNSESSTGAKKMDTHEQTLDEVKNNGTNDKIGALFVEDEKYQELKSGSRMDIVGESSNSSFPKSDDNLDSENKSTHEQCPTNSDSKKITKTPAYLAYEKIKTTYPPTTTNTFAIPPDCYQTPTCNQDSDASISEKTYTSLWSDFQKYRAKTDHKLLSKALPPALLTVPTWDEHLDFIDFQKLQNSPIYTAPFRLTTKHIRKHDEDIIGQKKLKEYYYSNWGRQNSAGPISARILKSSEDYINLCSGKSAYETEQKLTMKVPAASAAKNELTPETYELQNLFGGTENNSANENNSEDSLCIICMCDPSSIVVMPCRHMCLCGECVRSLRDRSQFRSYKCPICRERVSNYLEVTEQDGDSLKE